MKRHVFFVAIALLWATPAFAQEVRQSAAAVPGGFGVGVHSSATGNGSTFGAGISFDLGPMRFDPTFAVGIESVQVNGTRSDDGDFDAISSSETVYRLGTGIHGVLLEADRTRVFIGADLALGVLDASVTESSEENGIRTEVIDDTVTTFLSFTPVLGGEFMLGGGLALGLRVGPEVIWGSPDVENEPNIESARVFTLNGQARVDLTYYF